MKENEDKNEYEAEYKECLVSAGNHLKNKFLSFEAQRNLGDKRRLSNYRQYKGSNNFLREKNDREGDDKQYRNKSFYPYTMLKVDQFKAKSLGLFLPNGDKNFGYFPSNNPDIPEKKQQTIFNNLVERYGNEDAITDKVWKKAIQDYALNCAKRLEDYVYDLLIENGYKDIIAQMSLSASIYGYGISIGPFTKKSKKAFKTKDEFGNTAFKTKSIDIPYFEYCSVWDFYPDLSAKTLNQMEGAFINKIYSRKEFLDLSKKDNYISENIKEYMRCNPNGNYMPKDFENQIDTISNQKNDTLNSNKFRVYEYWGTIPYKFVKEYLEDTNQMMEDEDEDFECLGDIEVNMAIVDNVVIKCILNPWHSQRRPYHIYNLSLTDGELFGVGIPEKTYELQRLLNASIRCTVDNMFMTSGPMLEVNRDLIPADMQLGPIGSYKVIVREGGGELAGMPAVRQINLTNNTMQNLQVIEMIKQDFDTITSLTGVQFGDLSGQATAGRSSAGLNTLVSGSDTILKDTAKNFDTANESMLSLINETLQLINTEKDSDLDIIGDLQVIPKVSKGIIEKEQLSNKLIALNSTLRPEQMTYLDQYKYMQMVLQTQGIDPDDLMQDYDTVMAQQQQAQAQQQQMMDQQAQMQQYELQLKSQKAQTDQLKAQSKASLDAMNEQKILADMRAQQNKGQLDAILTANEIDRSRSEQEIKNNKIVGDLFSKEMDRQHQFDMQQISSPMNNPMDMQNQNSGE